MTTNPVMRWTGIVFLSMSTIRIRDVTEKSPPSLYNFSLQAVSPPSVQGSCAHVQKGGRALPLRFWHLVRDDLEAHADFFGKAAFLLRRRIDEQDELLRDIVNLELQARVSLSARHASTSKQPPHPLDSQKW